MWRLVCSISIQTNDLLIIKHQNNKQMKKITANEHTNKQHVWSVPYWWEWMENIWIIKSWQWVAWIKVKEKWVSSSILQRALSSNWFTAPLKVPPVAISGIKLPPLSSILCYLKSKFIEELLPRYENILSTNVWRKEVYWYFGFWSCVTWSKFKIWKS